VALSETPATIRRRAPEYGEHTEDVLLSVLGLQWQDITELQENKVI
jgi:crotonobetainyl-CoA:carnitine CoA-transferase CaiB-like acyl-CoA transferase